MPKFNTTQWRREDRTAEILEKDKYTVIHAKAGEPFHIMAVGPRGVRLILVESVADKLDARQIKMLSAIPVHPICSREVWRWRWKKRTPEITML